MGVDGQPKEFIEFSKILLATCMTGAAIERTRPYRSGTDAFTGCLNLEAYVTLLRGVFQPPSEHRSLKQELEAYKQRADEVCLTWRGQKHNVTLTCC